MIVVSPLAGQTPLAVIGNATRQSAPHTRIGSTWTRPTTMLDSLRLEDLFYFTLSAQLILGITNVDNDARCS
jgi:hypothetical protein